MITGPRRQFEHRVFSRGYTWDEVAPCVVAQDGEQITVDEKHWAYPHARSARNRKAEGGPGTELSRLLSWFGVVPDGECACKSKAAKMDALGSQWVRENIDIVLDWLEEEAKARGPIIRLAFNRLLAKGFVLQACLSADARNGPGQT